MSDPTKSPGMTDLMVLPETIDLTDAVEEMKKGELCDPDMLVDIFRRQAQLMQQLVLADKLPEWPIDLTSKYGQRQIKELIWAMVEEMAEASFILKNRPHRLSEHPELDMDHFREELADALAYFIEICAFAGIGPEELFREYCAKNAIVLRRVRDGY